MSRLPEADCTFCDIITEPPTAFDVHEPIADKKALITPALGMLMPGYFLAITSNHVTSFSQFTAENLARVDESLTTLEDGLTGLFGDYFRLEHGSDNISTCGSGGCIDHAHQHLVPADEDVGEHILDQLPWEQLDSYVDLAEFKGSPYIYLGRQAAHYALANPKLPGQWVRRQIAKVRELTNFDWVLDDGNHQLSETFKALESASNPPLNLHTAQLALRPMVDFPIASELRGSA